MSGIAAVVLAAGKSTRMKSKTIKVLHPVAGIPMIVHTVSALRPLTPNRLVVVIGRGGEEIRAILGSDVLYAEQQEQWGTGHALLQARPLVEGWAETVVCLVGDMPLIRTETIQALIAEHQQRAATVTLLTLRGPDSFGFGRIVRDEQGNPVAIVEEAVATPDQKAITEYNAGVYCFEGDWLWSRLATLPMSPGGEYYLTDILSVAVREGRRVATLETHDAHEVLGVNTRVHLAQAEAIMRQRIRERLMLEGVTLQDPETIYIDAGVTIAPDTVILPNTHIQGRTVIGPDCRIGPNSYLVDATIGARCIIWASVIEAAVLEDDVRVGPFAHLRPGAYIGQGSQLGNFAEVKNSRLGRGVHMGHMSYIGDAIVGDRVNIGAGTVTCNYDGVRKNQTVIGDDAFIGSDTMLVAPVTVGPRARTGAGSVVTHDIPADSLAYGVPARVVRRNESGGEM